MIALLETSFTPGADPTTSIVAADVALEADCTEAEAEAMLSASWAMVEAFTGTMYRDMDAGKVIVKLASAVPFRWPRCPFPAALTVEAYSGGVWVPSSARYIADVGTIDLEPFTLYRLTQEGTVPGAPVSAGVVQAVQNLALYQLIHAPSRREFKSQSSGDFSFSREALMPVFRGSGAGALLAGEVRI
ncbi:MAG: hypothetical protein J0L76_07670 [Rhodobacterales bacterium]|nr:hypothetical protein [Rhodobacterales bacterium]